MPFVSKDTFKETLYEQLGSGELEPQIERAGLEPLYRVVGVQLTAGVSVMAESNFDADSDLGPLRRLQREHDARLVQVYCSREKEQLLEHFVERIEEGERHPGHGDEPEGVSEVERKLEQGVWDPLDLPGELIEVERDVAAPASTTRRARARARAGGGVERLRNRTARSAVVLS